MTEVLYNDFELLHKKLVEYKFPNIPKMKVQAFVNDLFKLYTKNLDYFDLNDPDNFTKELLRELIKASRKNKKLIFLEDNQPYVISSTMTYLYLQRMYNFGDKKYFDNEIQVERELLKMNIDFKNKLNIEFCDSKERREIQISDVISGFVGKLYNFLTKKNETQIAEFVNELDVESESYMTLKSFFELMTISDDETAICFLKTCPLFLENRFELLFTMILEKNK